MTGEYTRALPDGKSRWNNVRIAKATAVDQPFTDGELQTYMGLTLLQLVEARFSRLYRAGGEPNSRLNARLKDASDSYPTSEAIAATPRDVELRARAASWSRHLKR